MDGVLHVDQDKVRSKVVHFYQDLYTKSESRRPSMDGLEFACIEEEERIALERDFSK